MDNQEINNAAKDYDALFAPDNVAAFEFGVDWLMNKPIFDRLTNDEKQKIQGYMLSLGCVYLANSKPTLGVLYNIFKDIFGDKLFGSQLTNENNIPEFQFDIDKIAEEYANYICPANGYDSEERYISDKYFAADECKCVLKWMNKKLKNNKI